MPKCESLLIPEAELEQVRNILAFWFQQPVHDLLKTSLTQEAFKELEDCRLCRARARVCALTVLLQLEDDRGKRDWIGSLGCNDDADTTATYIAEKRNDKRE